MLTRLKMLAAILALLLSACAPATTPAPTTEPPATQAATTEAPATEAPSGAVAKATPGKELNMVLLPKFLGNAVFDEAHAGALEAAEELKNPKELQFLAPASGG